MAEFGKGQESLTEQKNLISFEANRKTLSRKFSVRLWPPILFILLVANTFYIFWLTQAGDFFGMDPLFLLYWIHPLSLLVAVISFLAAFFYNKSARPQGISQDISYIIF